MSMNYHIPRIMMAAAASGCGKTTITCGLLQALLDRRCSLAAFKCGPDYIDPMFHKYVLGVDGGNLDSFFLGEEEICGQLVDGSAQKDMVVIEGVMGYFDGVAGVSTWASSYDIARITRTPVILVVDCRGASLSLAAVIQGFLQFGTVPGQTSGEVSRQKTGDAPGRESGTASGPKPAIASGPEPEFVPGNQIRGILLNRISAAMAERLKPEIEGLGVPVVGYLPDCEEMKLESRHLGLVRPEEMTRLHKQLELLAEQMKKTVDIDRICDIAKAAPDLVLADREKLCGNSTQDLVIADRENLCRNPIQEMKECATLRIGVARDSAFCFYYQENLRLLESMGVELVRFSPLEDKILPEHIDGMILGGGYPELYAKELSSNHSMIQTVKTAINTGMPYLAECGGFLYLHEELEAADGIIYPMVGVIRGRGYRTGKLSRFGYISLQARPEDCCLPAGIRGHEFHYWDSTSCGEDWEASKPLSSRKWNCVHSAEYQIGGFPHLYYPSNPVFLKQWLAGCRSYKDRQIDAAER